MAAKDLKFNCYWIKNQTGCLLICSLSFFCLLSFFSASSFSVRLFFLAPLSLKLTIQSNGIVSFSYLFVLAYWFYACSRCSLVFICDSEFINAQFHLTVHWIFIMFYARKSRNRDNVDVESLCLLFFFFFHSGSCCLQFASFSNPFTAVVNINAELCWLSFWVWLRIGSI